MEIDKDAWLYYVLSLLLIFGAGHRSRVYLSDELDENPTIIDPMRTNRGGNKCWQA